MKSNTRAHVDVSDVAGTSLSDATATAIVGYTLVHFAGFIALGVVAAVVVRMAARQATVLAGAFLAFVIAEAAFWVVIGLLNQGTLAGMLGGRSSRPETSSVVPSLASRCGVRTRSCLMRCESP